MRDEKIIFFDDLGFGWVVSDTVLREISPNPLRDELTADDDLLRIFQKPKRLPW